MPCLCYIPASQPIKKIATKTAHSSYLKELNNLKFRCYFSDECTQTLSYSNFTDPARDHSKHCDFTSYQCKNCHLPVFKRDLISHRYRCPSMLVDCRYCQINENGSFKRIKA